MGHAIAGESYCTYEGPDIITYKVADTFGSYDCEFYGEVDGVGGFAIASTSGNPGTEVHQWAASGDGTKSPVIAMNAYRLCNGRFEQVGLSWLKHSFCAVSEAMCNCQGTSCATLGIGCADTYWAGLNADAEAPRSEINATTGKYEYPFFQAPCGSNSVRGKLQIPFEDRNPSQNQDCLYFFEVQYVAADADPDWGADEYDHDNQFNNVSYRQVRFTSATNTSPIGDTVVMTPAIQAWADYSGATVAQVWTPELNGDIGLMHLGYKVTDNLDGTWNYQFNLHNQNSHRSGGSFSVPIAECVNVTNVEFRDLAYHSCELVESDDWQVDVTSDSVTWYCPENTNEWANALRWGSMYTFSFDADAPPNSGLATIGLWREGDEGAGDSIDAAIRGPLPDCEDCFGDLNGDGVINVNDVLILIAQWGGSGGDVNNDGTTDVNDLLDLLNVYDTAC
ncbi:MAG: hypothetical protein MK116_13340 [Phycisphaerales bacterium]|nr:hypothetical protein [Phycisphaerales bacterium]